MQSVFPVRTAHTEAWHRQVVGRGVSTSSEGIQILWSTCTLPADYTRFTPNHFVPLYPATNAHQLRPLTQLVPETASDTQVQSFAVCDVDSAYQPALHISTGVDGVATAPPPTMELGAVLADDNLAADDDGAPSYPRPSVTVVAPCTMLHESSLPDDQLMDVTANEEGVTYHLVHAGSSKSKDVLTDSYGYSYTAKPIKNTTRRYWRSVVWNNWTTCRATVIEENGSYRAGKFEHVCPSKIGITVARTVAAAVSIVAFSSPVS